MSRGFVREDDQEEAPFIPPRAPLPDGVANYVTPRGLDQLLDERRRLEEERKAATGSDDERRRQHAGIDGRLALLNERIVSARVMEAEAGDQNEVRFGNTVTFTFLSGPLSGQQRTFTIVGVDEASVPDGRSAFTAPLARALMGKCEGEEIGSTTRQAVQRARLDSIR